MNDHELKEYVSQRADGFMYGDYVRIVKADYNNEALDGIRMVHPNYITNMNQVLVYTPGGNNSLWNIEKLVRATRAEYVAYMRERGLVPRDE